MGLITGLLTLPLAPARGVVWAAEQVKRQAEREYYDSDRIQRELVEIDDAHAAGDLSESRRDELQEELVARLFEARQRRRAGEM